MGDINLYLGCGPLPIHPQHLQIIDDNWTFCDAYVQDPKIKKMDIRKIEYPDSSVSKIYCSHTLEHIGMGEVLPTLKEWYRALRSNGEVIINVPDLDWAIDEYVRLSRKEEPRSPVFNTKQKIMEIFFGNQTHEGEFHKSAYTEKGLQQVLEEAGFKNVTVKKVYEAHEMGCLVARAKK